MTAASKTTIRLKPRKFFYVASAGGSWYVVCARYMTTMRDHAQREFGKFVNVVREATDDEVSQYKREKGVGEIEVIE